MSDERTRRQLDLITEFVSLATSAGIECWLRGGWALDFLLGRVTRPHGDIDLFVWEDDAPRLLALLAEHGYAEIGGPPPEQQRNLVKAGEEFHVTLLERNDLGVVTAGGRWADSPWPAGMLDGPAGRIGDVRCRVISAVAQLWAKEEVPKALGHAQREYDPADIRLLHGAIAQAADPLAPQASDGGAGVDRYLQAVVGRLEGLLGTDLIGVYLHGSLVLGDFSVQRSDVDVVAVAARSLSDEEKREVGASLSQRALPCPASGLEFHLLVADALLPVEAPRFELHVATSARGEPDRVVDGAGRGGDTDLVMHFAVLHEHGKPLLGRSPSELFPVVPRPLLLRAFLDELSWARENASPSYLVLNACRAWRYAEEKLICSKTAGGEWASLRVLDATTIEVALRHRRDVTDEHPEPDAASALAADVEQRLREAIPQ